MREFFETFPWAESTLLEVVTRPRAAQGPEEVHMRVRWPDGSTGLVCFADCQVLSGTDPVDAEEPILAADMTDVFDAGHGTRPVRATSVMPVRCYSFSTALRTLSISAAHIEVR